MGCAEQGQQSTSTGYRRLSGKATEERAWVRLPAGANARVQVAAAWGAVGIHLATHEMVS